MKKIYTFFLCASISFISIDSLTAQVAINTDGSVPDPSAVLDLKSSDKGLLIPRITESERNSITDPAHSMLIYQTDTKKGYYFNKGTSMAPIWVMLATTEQCESRIPIDSIPFVIDNSGSYYLTDHMLQSSVDNGIVINTSNVTLDLNGYGLQGSAAFSSSGIVITGSLQNIHILNGYIDNWKNFGITGNGANHSTLTKLSISGNAYDGAFLGSGNVIKQCSFTDNGFDGLDVVNNNVILNSTFYSNNSDGLEAEHNNTIDNCTAADNTRSGFQANLANNIDQCTARDNGEEGFEVQLDNRLSRCTSNSNSGLGFSLGESTTIDDCHSSGNDSHGISFEGECVIRNSYSSGNTLSGFTSSSDGSRIENNQSTANSQKGFDITGSNNLVIKNGTRDNSGAAYGISIGNISGEIILGANITTSYNANANIQY